MSKVIRDRNHEIIFRGSGHLLRGRLGEKRRRIQILMGPRQVGKTTLVHQVLDRLGRKVHFQSADDQSLQGSAWIQQQWEVARRMDAAVLVLDEIQKIEGWSETVKKLWDEDTRKKSSIQVVLLGSAALILEKGLTESLAGRFEVIRVPHWSFSEMKDAFGMKSDEFIFFGGYPGTADLIHDFNRWRRMVLDSLIETTVSRDILLHARIEKPALLRRLFQLVCEYSGQILSYQKMVGHLQDVGNTTTLAHYLNLLEGAGLCCGLQKFEGKKVRLRSSIPKLQVFNTALMSAQANRSFESVRSDPQIWGRWVESSVGAHILNQSLVQDFEVNYWREGNYEVDFVIGSGNSWMAIEVKSGARRTTLPGMAKFLERFPRVKPLLVGDGGISVEEFLSNPILIK